MREGDFFLTREGKGEGSGVGRARGSGQDATGITKDNYRVFCVIFFTSHFLEGKGGGTANSEGL